MVCSGRKISFSLVTLFLFQSHCFALPFSISPKSGTTLPTTVQSGQTVTALYTVSNNTGRYRPDNSLQYLPPNVTQITTNNGITDLCGATFNLAAHGTIGDSCTMQLQISGVVNGDDPNPHHHLFVCFPGGRTCAGTQFPLNVHVISSSTQLTAVGQNQNSSTVLVSQDQGQQWTQQILPYPDGVQSSTLSGASCGTNYCVGVGTYTTNSGDLPGIATDSNFNASVWIQQLLPDIFDNGTAGTLNAVSCVGSTCHGAGIYLIHDAFQPYFATSQDSGVTWTQQVISPISNYLYLLVNGIHCSGNVCVAVGGYYDTNFIEHAYAAYSLNSGATWSQTAISMVDNTNSNQLNGVACSGLFCLAVGDYLMDNTSDDAPGVAITTNGGMTWINTILTVPSPYTQGLFNGISCTSNYCVAVGYYSNVSYVGYLGVAVTRDGGQTWNQQALPVPVDPAGLAQGILNGVKCTGNNCYAVGNYYTADFSALYPVIVTSTDAGLHWTQQVLVDDAETVLSGIG